MIGFVNCLKIPGYSSAREVAVIKRRFGANKTGHMGTLDPLAAGVLPIAIGNASRLFDAVSFMPKRYTASIRLGITTDTLDYGGKIIEEGNDTVSVNDFEEAIGQFRGCIQQIPPIYSAIKLDGRRAYDIARNGGTADMPVRSVTIYSLELIDTHDGEFLIDIHCSGGTYIRSLVRDIAGNLGTVGMMSALVRTEACGMNISGAKLSCEAGEADITPIHEVVEYPRMRLDGSELFRAKNGAVFDMDTCNVEEGSYIYIEDEMGIFAAAQILGSNTAKPVIKIR